MLTENCSALSVSKFSIFTFLIFERHFSFVARARKFLTLSVSSFINCPSVRFFMDSLSQVVNDGGAGTIAIDAN